LQTNDSGYRAHDVEFPALELDGTNGATSDLARRPRQLCLMNEWVAQAAQF
jgi:hypothetical protein